MKIVAFALVAFMACSAESCDRHQDEPGSPHRAHKVPEVNAPGAVIALTLLFGAIAIMKGRKE